MVVSGGRSTQRDVKYPARKSLSIVTFNVHPNRDSRLLQTSDSKMARDARGGPADPRFGYFLDGLCRTRRDVSRDISLTVDAAIGDAET